MKYICRNLDADCVADREWEGSVVLECKNEHNTELIIRGKGSRMYTIIGKYEYGQYICIPEWGVGSPIAGLKDVYWNCERLRQSMSYADAITVAEALKEYAKHYEDMA